MGVGIPLTPIYKGKEIKEHMNKTWLNIIRTILLENLEVFDSSQGITVSDVITES